MGKTNYELVEDIFGKEELENFINNESSINNMTLQEIEALDFTIVELIRDNAKENITNHNLTTMIFDKYSETKDFLKLFLILTDIEDILSSNLNRYIFKLVFKYEKEEELLRIIDKNETIKEYFQKKSLLSFIKSDLNSLL